jgi:hypothetical protein
MVRLKADTTSTARLKADTTMATRLTAEAWWPASAGPAQQARCEPAGAVPVRSFGNVHAIDNPDDRRVNRRALPPKSFTGCPSFDHDQHFLVHASTDRVHRQQRHATGLIIERDRLYQQQLGTLELAVLVRGNDGADDASELHGEIYEMTNLRIDELIAKFMDPVSNS